MLQPLLAGHIMQLGGNSADDVNTILSLWKSIQGKGQAYWVSSGFPYAKSFKRSS
jgi:hypothetical protein